MTMGMQLTLRAKNNPLVDFLGRGLLEREKPPPYDLSDASMKSNLDFRRLCYSLQYMGCPDQDTKLIESDWNKAWKDDIGPRMRNLAEVVRDEIGPRDDEIGPRDRDKTRKLLVAVHDVLMLLNHFGGYDFSVGRLFTASSNDSLEDSLEDNGPISLRIKWEENDGAVRIKPHWDNDKNKTEPMPTRFWEKPLSKERS